jgi:hypothetical protein
MDHVRKIAHVRPIVSRFVVGTQSHISPSCSVVPFRERKVWLPPLQQKTEFSIAITWNVDALFKSNLLLKAVQFW